MNKAFQIFSSLALGLLAFSSGFSEADAKVKPKKDVALRKECKCRNSKTGTYLELVSTLSHDRFNVSSLESFTMKSPQENQSDCQVELKKRTECGGTGAVTEPSKAEPKGIKIQPARMNETFYEVGLLPGDEVLSIDKAPVKSERDLNRIDERKKTGGRIDVQVKRQDSTVDLWFDFPK